MAAVAASAGGSSSGGNAPPALTAFEVLEPKVSPATLGLELALPSPVMLFPDCVQSGLEVEPQVLEVSDFLRTAADLDSDGDQDLAWAEAASSRALQECSTAIRSTSSVLASV